MKLLHIMLLLFALAATSCVTVVKEGERSGRANRGYREQDLALILTQDVQTAELVFTVKNTSPTPITNYFPATRFEGTVWFLQEGAVPLQTYPSNYLYIMIRGTPIHPEMVLPPNGTKTYRVPLETLVCPFSNRQPDGTRPVLAYGFMDGFKAVSNTIRLQHPDRIHWGRFDLLGIGVPQLIEKPK